MDMLLIMPNRSNLRIIFVICPGQGNYTRPDEARQVVNMAVSDGVITSHAFPQPNDLLQPLVLLQICLNSFTAQVRIAAGV